MKNEKVNITMFGGFSMSFNGHNIGNDSSNSQKMWELLSYLITFKGREISPNELIEVLWGNEELNNPINALKTLIYRTRQALDKLDIEGKRVLVSRRGSYLWDDSQVDMVIDVDLFDAYCRTAEAANTAEDKINAAKKAIEVYKGEFLSNLSDATWVMPRSVYYNNMLTRTVYTALDEYRKADRHEEILEMCTSALTVLPYDEPLNIRFIDTLVKLGRGQLALSHFNKVNKMLRLQFGVAPSPEFLKLSQDIAQMNGMSDMVDPNLIKPRTIEVEDGALFCATEVFDIICYYDAQTKTRNGNIACLATVTIADMDTNIALLEQKAKTLKETIHTSLRSSDCFCQRSPKQFEVLLQNTTYEFAEQVIKRVTRNFHNATPGLKCHLEYCVEQMRIPQLMDMNTKMTMKQK